MEYLALYRKYRPKELDEVVGQDEIKKILANSIENGNITHAYLFSGPRGTGKTTMAKILAKMVNCESPVNGNACNKCQSCLNVLNSNDVIEIDAASNNGVDEIRDLREKANFVPSNFRYKVYIIDEVHMLTTQAFNALLKTLEEPPKHVIFVLATTEYYKIPLTITSRCQKFQFNKIKVDEIVSRLRKISELEKISIDEDALYEIARISDGGMRDSINFLDQLRSFSGNNITTFDVYKVCGNVADDDMVNLFIEIKNNSAEKVTAFFEDMDFCGKNYSKFLEDTVSFLKDVILCKKNVNERYIKNNIVNVKQIAEMFSESQIFYMIESVNKLLDVLKNVSRASIMVISNFLLIMNNINNCENKLSPREDKIVDNEYEIAFKFTANGHVDSNDLDITSVKDEPVETSMILEMNEKYSDDTQKNIINNAFALASKTLKKNLQEKFNLVNDYLTNNKYKITAGLLIDTNIEVVGGNYIVFSGKNENVISKIYNNYELCSELLNEIFGDEYNFVVITGDEWNSYREEYINKIKNGEKYELKKIEKIIPNDIVSSDEPNVIDKLVELVGKSNVEFK